jgi:hypothetical protein
VDSKVARDKVGNALRDAVKQKLEESSEHHMLGMERSGSTASFMSDTGATVGAARNMIKGSSVPSVVSSSASSSLMNDSFKWNESSSNSIFSLHGNDEVASQSATLEQFGNHGAQPTPHFSTSFQTPMAAAMSCPSLVAAAANSGSSQQRHNSNHLNLPMFGPRLGQAVRSRSTGVKNAPWSNSNLNNNFARVQSNRFLQHSSGFGGTLPQQQQASTHHHGQLLGTINNSFQLQQHPVQNVTHGNVSSSSGSNSSNNNNNIQLVHFPTPRPASMDAPTSPFSSMMIQNTRSSTGNNNNNNNNNNNHALQASLLSSDIGDLQISNTSETTSSLMDYSNSGGEQDDSAERLSKDIEAFLKSMKSSKTGGGGAGAGDATNMMRPFYKNE